MLKILAIDGGGTRGVMPATALEQLELRLQKKHPGTLLRDHFDLVAGTSTGSIIALFIGLGIPMKVVKDLYISRSSEIFTDSIWDNILDLGNAIGAKYDQKYFKKILSEPDMFGTKTLADIDAWRGRDGKGIKIMIPSFDLSPVDANGENQNFRPILFHSYFKKHQSETLVDVALRSTAAQTYFPVREKKYVDGGTAINNPSMAALAFAMNTQTASEPTFGGESNQQKGLGKRVDNISLLSISTGSARTNRIVEADIDTGDWGATQWVTYLAPLLTESNTQSAHYYARNVLPEGAYYRLDFDFSELAKGSTIDIDCVDVSILTKLSEIALAEYQDKSDEFCSALGLD